LDTENYARFGKKYASKFQKKPRLKIQAGPLVDTYYSYAYLWMDKMYALLGW